MSILALGVEIGDLALFNDLELLQLRFSSRTQLYLPFCNGAWEPPFDTLAVHELARLSNCHTIRLVWVLRLCKHLDWQHSRARLLWMQKHSLWKWCGAGRPSTGSPTSAHPWMARECVCRNACITCALHLSLARRLSGFHEQSPS